jgi:peptidoglycan/xylan/chitin deacetylase (PgdA/CDA1 family)
MLPALGLSLSPAANAKQTAAVTATSAHVAPPHIQVLPWNGHRAALTLTFDDASPSEATEALPALDEEGVKGTFFVTTKNLEEEANDAVWAKAERDGHELGNHTVDHCHGPDLGRGRCLSARQEIERANLYIRSRLGARGVYTFAYPFVDQRGGYKRVAETDFLLARAGAGGLVESGKTPDWYSMDARFIEPTHGQTVSDWDSWIDETDVKGKWLVLVFHSILPETWCEGIPKDSLVAIIDHAKTSDDLWIDTFVNVGGYLRAQRMFEAVRPVPRDAGFVWKWTLPRHFPPGRTIRVTADRGTLEQAGTRLTPDLSGAYNVALDARVLAWAP